MNDISKGSRVIATIDGAKYAGTVTRLKGRKQMRFAVVEFDDGDVIDFEVAELMTEDELKQTMIENAEAEALEPDPYENGDTYDPKGSSDGGGGFHVYPVTWTKDRMSFKCEVTIEDSDFGITEAANKLLGETFIFHGRWVRTQCSKMSGGSRIPVICWDLDIYGQLKSDPSISYYVECIHYDLTVYDELTVRSDVRSRNKDICMAIRKFVFKELVPMGKSIREVQKMAMHPMLDVPSLDWFDKMIFSLQQARTTACRVGGQRSVILETGQEGSPRVMLNIDFTDIAIKTEGKPPPSMMGGVIKNSKRRKSKGDAKPKPEKLVADDKNVEDLQEMLVELNAAAKAGDKSAKSEARKIRSALRSMGVAGGSKRRKAKA